MADMRKGDACFLFRNDFEGVKTIFVGIGALGFGTNIYICQRDVFFVQNNTGDGCSLR